MLSENIYNFAYSKSILTSHTECKLQITLTRINFKEFHNEKIKYFYVISWNESIKFSRCYLAINKTSVSQSESSERVKDAKMQRNGVNNCQLDKLHRK